MAELRPASGMIAVRAFWHKLRLLRAYRTLWPAAGRGARLLIQARFRDFGRKLFNEVDEVRSCEHHPRQSRPRLFIAGHLLGTGGYDHLVCTMLTGLLGRGIALGRDHGFLFRKEILPAELRPVRSIRADEPRLLITPPHLLERFTPDSRTAVLTMWETDTLPHRAVRYLNRSGLVIVPSRWGRDCFRENGVVVPIAVVPLGFDPLTFSPSPPPLCGPTTFGTAGALDQGGLRKNVQRVIELFRRAFPDEPGVRLRVKITPTSPMVTTYGDARIEVIQGILSAAELANWYRSLNVFVNASFGEGFGLHLLEAMACGRPLISSMFGGVSEFFDAEVGFPVRHRLIAARNTIYHGRWAAPEDAGLINAMRSVHADPQVAARFGVAAAGRASSLTWDATIDNLIATLEEHQMYVLSK